MLNNYRHFFENRWGHYDYAYRLDTTAEYVAQYFELLETYQASLPADRFQIVEYESLVTDFETEVRRVLSFCDLPFENACLNFQDNPDAVASPSALQVREPVHARSVGRWKGYEPYIGEGLDVLKRAGLLPD